MANFKQDFMRYMDAQGVKYTDTAEFRVRVAYTGENLKSIPVYVTFDSDGDNLVQFHCWEIANFKDKLSDGIFACNFLNAKYRWGKFYIDDDGDVVCSTDAYLGADCGSECLSLVHRVVNITDQAYPVFMKALYS